jgi:hypothetical protein
MWGKTVADHNAGLIATDRADKAHKGSSEGF